MILDEFIKELESPNIHRVAVDTNELLAFLKELKGARELIRHQSQCIESQARYIEEHIDRR
jgi:hypothetical protein